MAAVVSAAISAVSIVAKFALVIALTCALVNAAACDVPNDTN